MAVRRQELSHEEAVSRVVFDMEDSGHRWRRRTLASSLLRRERATTFLALHAASCPLRSPVAAAPDPGRSGAHVPCELRLQPSDVSARARADERVDERRCQAGRRSRTDAHACTSAHACTNARRCTDALRRAPEAPLGIVDVAVGKGEAAKAGDKVKVHYTGTLTNGTEFDSSRTRNQPFEFVLGQGRVIKGWDQGVAGMKVGGKRKLTIPPSLGYGARGAGGKIPPNSTLLFDVELVEIGK